jgi:hypothetical protein
MNMDPTLRTAFTRRAVLRGAIAGAGALTVSRWLSPFRAFASQPPGSGAARPALGEPDVNGVRLPPGFTSRIVARSGKRPAPGSAYVWHASPDGGACFASSDGGWVYASNSELPGGGGGAGALRFDARGEVVDAYRLLGDTTLNCAGGATPWGTWLSCEEYPQGRVWECDPLGHEPAVVRPALGVFKHEDATVDPAAGRVYLTEDAPEGRFYRFTPARPAEAGRFDLSAGVLEVAEVVGGAEGALRWHAVPDPSAARGPTARQVPESTAFPGSEGMAWHAGTLYFATKFDNRIWAYDTVAGSIRIFYDDDRYADPLLTGVDNVAVAPTGEVLVAEDGGDMQLVAITATGELYPFLQVVTHMGSEIAGPAFDPSGTRLYFSSQRGPIGLLSGGITFEVTGPFKAA